MKILISGSGKMGKMVASVIEKTAGAELVGMYDETSLDTVSGDDKLADVIIDFSHPSMLPALLRHSKATSTAVVIGTTGLSADDLRAIEENGKYAPTLYSANYSRGIAVLNHILPIIKSALGGDFDIELCETHHNKKIDAPSGTAKLLLRSLDPNDEYEKVEGRSGVTGARKKSEIGVHAIRGGTVAGIHSVSFFGPDEVVEIRHEAFDRKIFAEGAVAAAMKLAVKENGVYSLDELMFENE